MKTICKYIGYTVLGIIGLYLLFIAFGLFLYSIFTITDYILGFK